ncbi:MAG TPA: FAD-dependent oxidoreductase [Streptosporangiaceae bacterium]
MAWAGTGRNGRFWAASLTHGLSNGQGRFPVSWPRSSAWTGGNWTRSKSSRHDIDCDFARTGELWVATEPWRVERLRESAALAARLCSDVRPLDGDAVRAELLLPTYLGGLWDAEGCATLDPARLAGARGEHAWRLASASQLVGGPGAGAESDPSNSSGP